MEGGRGLCVAHLALVTVQGLVPLATIWSLKLVVDSISTGAATELEQQAAIEQLWIAVALAAGVMLVSQLVRTVTRLVGQLHGDRVADHVAARIHAHANALGLEDFEDPEFHDALQRAHSEGPHRPVAIVGGVAGLLRAAVTTVTMVAVVASLHALAPVVVVLVAVPTALVRLKHARRLLDWQTERTRDVRLANYYGAALTSPQAAKDIRAFGLGRVLADRYVSLRSRLRRERFGLSTRRSVAEFAASLPSLSVVFGAYLWLGIRAIAGAVTLGWLVLQTQAIQRLQSSVGELVSGCARLIEDGMFFRHYLDFLSRSSALEASGTSVKVPEHFEILRLEDVTFAYPGRDEPALDGVSLELRRGDRIAFVGSNGAGKSTLIRLLCRLHDPDSGRITCDGIDLRQFDPAAWRRGLAVLFQDAVPFETTLEDNIAFGDLESEASVEVAARLAGVHDRIAGLPNGYQTRASRRFPDGTELSVGERRKLLLARVLHREALIVVLDEPSASLDPRSEVEIFGRLTAALNGRTLLFVTHRPGGLAFATRIVELQGGRVVRDERRLET